ncbi:MAG: hypothetical protein EPO03_12010 [Porticoccaceae bacterium]|nr:MAG: hypothetical protein EPO03_12010 [Porticoccaceae bacterium]
MADDASEVDVLETDATTAKSKKKPKEGKEPAKDSAKDPAKDEKPLWTMAALADARDEIVDLVKERYRVTVTLEFRARARGSTIRAGRWETRTFVPANPPLRDEKLQLVDSNDRTLHVFPSTIFEYTTIDTIAEPPRQEVPEEPKNTPQPPKTQAPPPKVTKRRTQPEEVVEDDVEEDEEKKPPSAKKPVVRKRPAVDFVLDDEGILDEAPVRRIPRIETGGVHIEVDEASDFLLDASRNAHLRRISPLMKVPKHIEYASLWKYSHVWHAKFHDEGAGPGNVIAEWRAILNSDFNTQNMRSDFAKTEREELASAFTEWLALSARAPSDMEWRLGQRLLEGLMRLQIFCTLGWEAVAEFKAKTTLAWSKANIDYGPIYADAEKAARSGGRFRGPNAKKPHQPQQQHNYQQQHGQQQQHGRGRGFGRGQGN